MGPTSGELLHLVRKKMQTDNKKAKRTYPLAIIMCNS